MCTEAPKVPQKFPGQYKVFQNSMETQQYLLYVKQHRNYFTVIINFNIRLCYISFNGILSLWSCFLFVCFCGFNNKKQALCENQYGMGNEGGSVQSDSKIWEVVQSPVGTHFLSITNYGYIRMK